MPLWNPIRVPGRRADVEVRRGSVRLFSRLRRQARVRTIDEPWFQHADLPGGAQYLRWAGLFEFRVSADGRAIDASALDGASTEAFRTYLLGQVLSFALLRRGIEPLHSTAVVADGGAVAFIGDCGHGKSTLGGAFLRAGATLLTDDLLVVREGPHGVLASPGPPRIKLFPDVARRLFGPRTAGTPMNPGTPKLVIPLDRRHTCASPAPLRAVYVLASRARRIPASAGITIRRLSPRRACVELLRNTFNVVVSEPRRLERQLTMAARLAETVPVMRLGYPRDLARLPAVVDAIRSRR